MCREKQLRRNKMQNPQENLFTKAAGLYQKALQIYPFEGKHHFLFASKLLFVLRVKR